MKNKNTLVGHPDGSTNKNEDLDDVPKNRKQKVKKEKHKKKASINNQEDIFDLNKKL